MGFEASGKLGDATENRTALKSMLVSSTIIQRRWREHEVFSVFVRLYFLRDLGI